MRISQRGLVSLQLDETGKNVLEEAGIQPEEALAVYVVDEDDRGLWIRIQRAGALYWLLIQWSFIRSVEIPAPAKIKGI